MQKFRNNLFYASAIIGFISWIVNTVAVMRICGVTHPIILRELFYLGILIYIFYSYAQKIYEDIDTAPFNGRAEVSKGDVLVFRFFGPWLSLFAQLMLTLMLLNSVHEKLFSEEKPQRVCELRGRYQ